MIEAMTIFEYFRLSGKNIQTAPFLARNQGCKGFSKDKELASTRPPILCI